jgi:hypothetical protein
MIAISYFWALAVVGLVQVVLADHCYQQSQLTYGAVLTSGIAYSDLG